MSSATEKDLIDSDKKTELPLVYLPPAEIHFTDAPDSPEIDYSNVTTEMKLEPLKEDDTDLDKDIEIYHLPFSIPLESIKKWDPVSYTFNFDNPFIDKIANYQCALTKFYFPMSILPSVTYDNPGVFTYGKKMHFEVRAYGSFTLDDYIVSENSLSTLVRNMNRAVVNFVNKLIVYLEKLSKSTLENDKKMYRCLKAYCEKYNILNNGEIFLSFQLENEFLVIRKKTFADQSYEMQLIGDEFFSGQMKVYFEKGFLSTIIKDKIVDIRRDDYEYIEGISSKNTFYEGAFTIIKCTLQRENRTEIERFQKVRILSPDLGLRETVDTTNTKGWKNNITQPILYEYYFQDEDYTKNAIIENINPPIFHDIRKSLPIKRLTFILELVTLNNKAVSLISKGGNQFIQFNLMFVKKKNTAKTSDTSPPPKQKPKLVYIPPEKLKLDTL